MGSKKSLVAGFVHNAFVVKSKLDNDSVLLSTRLNALTQGVKTLQVGRQYSPHMPRQGSQVCNVLTLVALASLGKDANGLSGDSLHNGAGGKSLAYDVSWLDPSWATAQYGFNVHVRVAVDADGKVDLGNTLYKLGPAKRVKQLLALGQ